MKIEIGESLLYSWLHHVKECQIVQTNWKPAPEWELRDKDRIVEFMRKSDERFAADFEFVIYKNNSLDQLVQQAEVDVIGLSFASEGCSIYAIDVAFHGAGLNYGDRETTVSRVVKKCLRTAMCLFGYFGAEAKGEIIFASPKINNAEIMDLEFCLISVNELMVESGFPYFVRIIANQDFDELILKPILIASEGISDTNELFIRSYQMFQMFSGKRMTSRTQKPVSNRVKTGTGLPELSLDASTASLQELKIGVIAQTVLRDILESGGISADEIAGLQSREYSKAIFDLQYPLLVKASADFEKIRYYSKPLQIHGEIFYLCSQWFEVPANNDKPYLLSWILGHQA
jgi:hypothetical protein